MTIKSKTRSRVRKGSYAKVGVDIDEMMSALTDIKKMVRSTAGSSVISDIGSFGGMFRSPGRDKVLVASADGVGTKLKVAVMAGRHTTVGQDLVNHCVNDILVQGATPLFFLDYLGTSKLSGAVFKDIVWGLCKACRENQCALLGGETAEMPGLYPKNEYDLVGTIVGAVDRKSIVTGESIRPGDTIIGLPATGLHTNGYSLARKVIFETAGLKITDRFPGARKTVADVLLDVHRSYLAPVKQLAARVRIHGMAHITGGGLVDNVPRVLPSNTRAVINLDSWRPPEVFDFIMQHGKVDRDEMYRVFNMGIGFILIVRSRDTDKAFRLLQKLGHAPVTAGRIVKGKKGVTLKD
jgi:phosphoribosylformylglycinamidine cyclo-ligase